MLRSVQGQARTSDQPDTGECTGCRNRHTWRPRLRHGSRGQPRDQTHAGTWVSTAMSSMGLVRWIPKSRIRMLMAMLAIFRPTPSKARNRLATAAPLLPLAQRRAASPPYLFVNICRMAGEEIVPSRWPAGGRTTRVQRPTRSSEASAACRSRNPRWPHGSRVEYSKRFRPSFAGPRCRPARMRADNGRGDQPACSKWGRQVGDPRFSKNRPSPTSLRLSPKEGIPLACPPPINFTCHVGRGHRCSLTTR